MNLAEMQRVIAANERCNSQRAAARSLDMAESTYRGVLKKAQQFFARGKPRISVKATIEKPRVKRSDYIRCLDIGDPHDKPGRSKDRFYWMGCFAREQGVDRITIIGDFSDLDSLNKHVKNETYYGKFKPTFEQDISSMREALEEFKRGLSGYSVPMHITLGNHEHRAWRFADDHPEMYGIQKQITDLFEEYGWTWSKYGEWHFIGNVGYTHIPFNAMGQPYGGKTQHSRIAADVTHDVVCGHSHQQQQFRAAKLNKNDVTIVNLGCALPQDEIEDYASLSNGGWWWGVAINTIKDGKLNGNVKWFEMWELEEMYG